MAHMNILHHINLYNDLNATNQPVQSIGKWTTDIQGISVNEPEAKLLKLGSGESLDLFSSSVVLSDNNTTEYSLSLKVGTMNTYRIEHTAGTAPNFRTARVTGADNTTVVTAMKNGPILVLTSTSGSLFNLIVNGVQVGDEVRLGDEFNPANRGKFKILARTATSISIENQAGVDENVSISDADQVKIQSSSGVQVGNKLIISQGFSEASFGTFEITDVDSSYIEIYSGKSLPSESDILVQLDIFNNSKKVVYLESDKEVEVFVNGYSAGLVEPLACGTKPKKGMFLKTGATYSLSVTSKSIDQANILVISAE
jgi:hypothetical protein